MTTMILLPADAPHQYRRNLRRLYRTMRSTYRWPVEAARGHVATTMERDDLRAARAEANEEFDDFD